jgi:hypothetical protein
LNLERDGAPDIPDGTEGCGCCLHFFPVGMCGTGFCSIDFNEWIERCDAMGERVTGRSTAAWIQENCIEECHESCSQFEEYG